MGKFKDLSGQKFSRLTVITRVNNSKSNDARWLCKCDCGNETVLTSYNLTKNITKSCGCYQKEILSQHKTKDLTNNKFGRLIVIARSGSNKQGHSTWKCKCDCGNETIVVGTKLTNGQTTSCGCYKKGVTSKNFKDITGQRFGRLIVIEYAQRKRNGTFWRCKCSCGNETIVRSRSLIDDLTTSCGCYGKEMRTLANKKEYCEASFNLLLSNYKTSARTRGLDFLLTENEFKELISAKCSYCNKEPSKIIINKSKNGNIIYNGIDRIDNCKGYITGNVRTCCTQCNILKGSDTENEFYSWVEAIYKNLNIDNNMNKEEM